MQHRWQLNADGEIDIWALDVDYHNGPECTRCWRVFCEHCNPMCYQEECPGDRYQQMGQLSLFGEDVA